MDGRLGLTFGTRVAKSPFFDETLAAGAVSFTVYNHTWMPTSYGDAEAEYWRLIEAAAMWDVACQVQVELTGPDAGELTQAVVCRDLTGMRVGRAKYAPMVDHRGRLMNDPVALRVDEDRWWLSLADSDMLYWCRAVGAERGLDAEATQPEVFPLAVQGPRAADVVADLFGGWVRDLPRFGVRPAEVDGIEAHLGRSGWSGRDGFEIYLCGRRRGSDLWKLVAEAGRPYGIGPGAPNYIERMESGLLSYRADTLDDSDPFEAGLERFVDLDSGADFIGRAALEAIRRAGPRRRRVGVFIDGAPLAPPGHPWPITAGGADEPVGTLRAAAHSPRLARNIGVALLEAPYARPGTKVTVQTPTGARPAQVTPLPFIKPQP